MSSKIERPAIVPVTKCLFPVAGYGTRFLPATKAVPKEMLPVVDKPLLQYCVEEVLAAGLNDICLVTGRGKHAIVDYFDNNYELEKELSGSPKMEKLKSINEVLRNARFSFTRQKIVRGLGDAVSVGEVLIGRNPFALILSDNLCFTPDNKPNIIDQLLMAYERYGCSVIAVHEVDPAVRHLYGIVSGAADASGCIAVRDMIEKPTKNQGDGNLAIVGRYILTPTIFDILSRTKAGINGEIQLTDALSELLKHEQVMAVPITMDYFDCGNIDGFVQAVNYCYKRFRN